MFGPKIVEPQNRSESSGFFTPVDPLDLHIYAEQMGQAIFYFWLLGLVVGCLITAGAVRFLLTKQYVKAGICLGIVLIAAGFYGFYKYEENERLVLNKPLNQPAANSLIPASDAIPNFFVKSLEYFNGFQSRYEYVYPEDLGKSGRPPKLFVNFELFNKFQTDCLGQHELNAFLYGTPPAGIIKLPTGQEANFFVSDENGQSTMKISMDDQFGCLEIFAEFSKDLTKRDMINILNSMVRVR